MTKLGMEMTKVGTGMKAWAKRLMKTKKKGSAVVETVALVLVVIAICVLFKGLLSDLLTVIFPQIEQSALKLLG
jgi:hypothetical protein